MGGILARVGVSASAPGAPEPYLVRLDTSAPAARLREVRMTEGDGAADVDTDASAPFPQAMAEIDALVKSGTIRKRDRKARFDGCDVRSDGGLSFAEVRVGPTHYEECARDIRNPQEVRRRAALGRERHGDPYRYLACGTGVLLLPTTADGRVLLGVRGGGAHPGLLHGPAGWLPFRRRVAQIDPAGHALTECEEELGLTGLEPPELLGVVSYRATYETDLVFTSRAPDGLLEELVARRSWTRAQDAREHTDVLLLTPRQALRASPANPQPLMPSTRFGLQALARTPDTGATAPADRHVTHWTAAHRPGDKP